MTVQLKDMLNRLYPAEQQAVAARATELIAAEMFLRDLREAHHLTQKRMAESLGIGTETPAVRSDPKPTRK
jgi:hypothetical protein